jgi:hypothetical protein
MDRAEPPEPEVNPGADGGPITVAETTADTALVNEPLVAVIVKFVRPPASPVMVAGLVVTFDVTVWSVIVLYAVIV